MLVEVTDVSTASGGHPQSQVKSIRQVRLFMCLVRSVTSYVGGCLREVWLCGCCPWVVCCCQSVAWVLCMVSFYCLVEL